MQSPIRNGDMGVDLFFVLSGFLMTDILLKELDRDGKINTFHFLRSRFLRVWPGMLVPILMFLGLGFETVKNSILILLFVGNIFGLYSYLWTVCVEFQFYLISPFLVKKLHNSDNPGLMISVLFLASMFLNLGTYLYADPESLHKNLNEQIGTADVYFFYNYEQMPTRASPYLFGMYAAYLYQKDKSFDSVALEWLSVFGIALSSTIGAAPMFTGDYLGYKANLAAAILCRPLLGLSWAYMIYIMLTKEEIGCHRPSRWIKAILEWAVWTPIANLSYSIYLTHLLVIFFGDFLINTFKSQEEMEFEKNPTMELPEGCPVTFK